MGPAGAARAVSRRYIADFVSKAHRTKASAGFVGASAVGMALGPLLARLFESFPELHVGRFTLNSITMGGCAPPCPVPQPRPVPQPISNRLKGFRLQPQSPVSSGIGCSSRGARRTSSSTCTAQWASSVPYTPIPYIQSRGARRTSSSSVSHILPSGLPVGSGLQT